MYYVSRGVKCFVDGQSEVISLLSSVFLLLCIASDLKKQKKKWFEWNLYALYTPFTLKKMKRLPLPNLFSL